MKRIYISLANSSEEEFQQATEIMKPIKGRGVLLWNDAPAAMRWAKAKSLRPQHSDPSKTQTGNA